jgi:DNA anti-recombination protein RmuC
MLTSLTRGSAALRKRYNWRDLDSENTMKSFVYVRRLNELALAGMLTFLLLSAANVAAQAVDPSQTSDASVASGQQRREPDNPFSQQQKRDLVKKQNEQREQDIKKDTDKLLELATELKQYVDKTNENIISLDVIRKAEQIEKLAKTVKDKMKAP